MAREALFNILRDRVEGATVLDLFAGAGTVGIEALSRGASWCVFVERSRSTREFLERNLAHTRLAEFCDVLERDVFRCLDALGGLGRRFDIVYVGPPFPLWLDRRRSESLFDLLASIAKAGLLNPDAVAVLQHEAKTEMREMLVQFRFSDRRRYGRNWLSLYKYAGKCG